MATPGWGVARPLAVSAWLRTLSWPVELRLTGRLSGMPPPSPAWASATDTMLLSRLMPWRWLANKSRANRALAPPAANATSCHEENRKTDKGHQVVAGSKLTATRSGKYHFLQWVKCCHALHIIVLAPLESATELGISMLGQTCTGIAK